MLYLGVSHYEHIAKDRVQEAAVSLGAAHAALRHDYAVLFNQASDLYDGTAHKSVILDLFIKSILPLDAKCAGNHPFNVIGQAGQNVCVIGFAKSFHVALHSLFILGHSFIPLVVDGNVMGLA
jgi:hypothetical protein